MQIEFENFDIDEGNEAAAADIGWREGQRQA